MKIKKAVIPAAGYGTRFLPATKSLPKEMLPILDKPTIQWIIEEAVKAGIEEILIITNHQKSSIENHFDRSLELEMYLNEHNKLEELKLIRDISDLVTIHSVRQKEQKGLGHAILCAKTFIGNDPFAVLLGDDIVINNDYPAIKQLCDAFEKDNSSIVGVQKVNIEDVDKYGIVKTKEPLNDENNFSRIEMMVEKPSVEVAPSQFAVLGRYVLTSDIFDYLENQSAGNNGEIQLTDALNRMAQEKIINAICFEGKRYDVGSKLGYLEATIDYALNRKDMKDDVIKMLKEKVKNND